MSRTLVSTAHRVCIRSHTNISSSHTRLFHNVRLVELHDTLHQVQEPTPQLHGITLHPQKYPQGSLYESAFQSLQSCKETGAQKIKTGPVCVQYGPLFEKAKQNLVALTYVATAAGNTLSETRPGKVIKVAKKIAESASKLPASKLPTL